MVALCWNNGVSFISKLGINTALCKALRESPSLISEVLLWWLCAGIMESPSLVS